MQLLSALLLLPLLTPALSQACTFNANCTIQGQCCSRLTNACQSTSYCVLDGLAQNNDSCDSNSECATGCCSSLWKDCSYTASSCLDDEQGLTGRGIFVIILAVLAVVALVLIFCIGFHKIKKEKS